MRKTEYLIIGQGLAGTLFAHQLDQYGHDFIVIDPNVHNASKTAAGMYNPVVLKRFSPVWQGKTQISLAQQTLQTLEKQLQATFDYPFDIFRIFHNDEEKSTWQHKATTLSGLIDTNCYASPSDTVDAPHGMGKVNYGGRADINTLLTAYRHYLTQKNAIITDTIDYDQLTITPKGFRYQDIHAEKVICCEGYGIKANPYFNDLPLKGNKGETLIVRIANLHLTEAIKSKVFIMPMPELGHDLFFVGSTYNWTDKDTTPSKAAESELLEKLSHFINAPIEVISHRAGIRPTVIDRRPLLGRHPSHKHLYILNGLGTRGVMLGASMAKQLYAYIVHQHQLDASVDIARFYS